MRAETAESLEPGLEGLHPRAATLFRLGTLWRGGLLTGAIFAAEWVIRPAIPFLLATGVVGTLVILTAIITPPLRYRAWGFILRESDLFVRHGVLFRTTSIVPNARIQHVDTRHGPIDRWLGLSELVIFTAGIRGSVISIPGLEAARAETLRDHLAAVSGAGDAV